MTTNYKNKVIVIGGPTASGKSALAMDVAQEFNAVIINADSMQIYDGLRIITARPSPQDEARLPHRLYGIMDPSETCSAGAWEKLCIAEIQTCWANDQLPVVTGGTGLYIKALVEGLSKLPDIPADIRDSIRKRAAMEGIDSLYKDLQAKDPVMAARLKPADKQRICRALEVFEASGRSLAELQEEFKPEPRLKADYATHVIIPPRDILYERCNQRFDQMMHAGALSEVESFMRRNLDQNLPAMKALGVPELIQYLEGELSLEDARERAQMQTRRFAKRQCTWFNNQITQLEIHSAQYSESLRDKIYKKIRQFLLTPSS